MKNFYKNKRVFVTGHTGFKGVWLSKWLLFLGADVLGYALPLTDMRKEVYLKSNLSDMRSIYGDIRDLDHLTKVFEDFKPEIVLHLAAQPLVLEAYKNPVKTYETNVMGVVNILECVRKTKSVRSFLNITTDKVYENKEWYWGYRENDRLNGHDPYSNSKSCSELITHSYKKSFFTDDRCAISTARAGNVIGGGDFSENRIIPDCIRAAFAKKNITVRNPNSIRPYQFVLEPLYAYLMLAKAQYENGKLAGEYNIGPNDSDIITTSELVSMFCKYWGEGLSWQSQNIKTSPEAKILKLDSTKIKESIHWRPIYNIEQAVKKTVIWAKCWQNNEDMETLTLKQIEEFLKETNNDKRGNA